MNRLQKLWSLPARCLKILAVPFRIAGKAASAIFWFAWKLLLAYGEAPGRVLIIIAAVFVATWLLYWQVGCFALESDGENLQTCHTELETALYYSLVSFTALGYGSWAPEPTGWAKWVGAVQPFIGIFSAVILSIWAARLFRRRNRN